MGLKLAIVGATGLVGTELISIIEALKPRLDHLGLIASSASSGSKMYVTGREYVLESLDECDFSQYDAAVFSVGDELSAAHVPRAVESGCAVIDKSNAYRLSPEVPLVVPGVNDAAVQSGSRLIANPNCTTIILTHALGPIKRSLGLRQVFAATYQSISGAGRSGIRKLFNEIDELGFSHERYRIGQYKSEAGGLPLDTLIAHSVQPQIGRLDESDRCGEETKLVKESRKILSSPGLPFFAHSVRVPVPVGHSIAVTIQTEKKTDNLAAILDEAGRYVDRPTQHLPNPLDSGIGLFRNVEVGRIRREAELENGWSFFVCGDNLRIGAALNGWRILELMAQRGIIPAFAANQGVTDG